MPGLKRLRNGAIDEQRGAAGEAHAFDLVRVLDHAAAGGDGCGADDVQVRIGRADALGKDEVHVLVEADGGGAESAVAGALCRARRKGFRLPAR